MATARRFKLRRISLALLLIAGLLGGIAWPAVAGDPIGSSVQGGAAGLRYDNLQPVVGPSDPCAPLPYRVDVAPGVVGCTHGPDPAPSGIDVRVAPPLADLAAPAGAAGTESVPCIGDGSAGKRFEAIYAYVSGGASRYVEVAPLIRGWAAAADGVVNSSAALTGGVRHLRWLHDASCQPIVHEVALSALASVDFESMVAELYYAGYDRTDRRYVVWVDISGAYCGIALNTVDEQPGVQNLNKGVPGAELGVRARIDLPCWGNAAPGTLVEAHEILHTLGAVQPHAPNSSSVVHADGSIDYWGHCVDEYDTMCYADGSPKSLVFRCGPAYDRLLDCNHEDYFNLAPPSGSYLSMHWNTASSAFLVRVDPIAGFLDIGGSPFSPDIAWLAASGITKGCGASQELFCPDAAITRGQMAAFLDRALHLDPTALDFFTDDDTSIFEPSINRLAASGITQGCGGGLYCPTLIVTREQMAAFLHRAFG